MVNKLILKVFKKLGYRIEKINSKSSNIPTGLIGMNESLKRLYDIGIRPNCIIDVGAAKGSWSLLALNYYPTASFLLVEPIKKQINKIPVSLQKNRNVEIVNAVLAEADGEVHFNITDDVDGSGVYLDSAENSIILPSKKLDNLVKKDGDILLKLDTHGYELPILKGAVETLSKTIGIIVEVYGFKVSPTCLLFHEISQLLHDQGFRLFDIVDIMRRPGDNSFWQADAVYLKSTHPVFSSNDYHG